MTSTDSFEQFNLQPLIQAALKAVGYEAPTPIQSAAIPPMLEGSDIIGQAQTGTGKTAAFALPILQHVETRSKHVQALVLVPTRELAIQVSEAINTYASKMKGFHVLPVYGGQDYKIQLKPLQRGVQVVVGTPGRVMDHMRRKTLKLDKLKVMVLDEADEMLRMGFADDVEWVMEHVPEQRQVALFSATMPSRIKNIASKYLHEPRHIEIAQKTVTAESVRQRYWLVEGVHKLNALTRILEFEDFDAMIVFVRTKSMTDELAVKLQARGFAAVALSGDVPQKKRELTINQLREGKCDILVATDVAARGLDVTRITHVVNYDIPYDTEAYVHRIGRTGRAGKRGEAILFATGRERRLLRSIEKATGKTIRPMKLPTLAEVNEKRLQRLAEKVASQLKPDANDEYDQLILHLKQQLGASAELIASALARLSLGDQVKEVEETAPPKSRSRDKRAKEKTLPSRRDKAPGSKRSEGPPEGMLRYRLEVGLKQGVKASNIVGAIANEAGIESRYIDNVSIFDEHSTVDLPAGMPRGLLKALRKTWVCGKRLQISELKPSAARKKQRSTKKPAAEGTAKRKREK